MKKLFLLPLIFVSATVFGWSHESGTKKISSLNFDMGGLRVRFDPAPAACNGGDQYRMHAHLTPTDPNYKELVSALLAAYTAGLEVSDIWFDFSSSSCNGSNSLNLKSFEFVQK